MFCEDVDANATSGVSEMRNKIELEVIGEKKLRPIYLMDVEYEVLKKRAEFLGVSISEYVGLVLCAHNSKVNEAIGDLFGVGVDA